MASNAFLYLGGAALLLAACSTQPIPAPDTELPLFGGYRSAEDPCQRVGETDQTNTYLSDAADLVGCPVGSPEAEAFAAETGGFVVATLGGYTLFSVPRR
ncbi:hypothetical protein [Dinoroseobacter sp. S124A]|uniref:hypothetical protein n=1 Tax=Dinoroseobacter sp. S124A TaxID=3415128 RepID=UPI003C7CCA7F